jgi:tyrosyl-tRNA synthetase
MKTLKNKEKFVVTTKLLEDNQGQKMGKTEGNMVALSDNPDQMYGKIMSWSDGLIISSFELCTYVSMSEIEELKESLSFGKINPRDLKMRLAKEITSILYDPEKAGKAEQNFIKTFQKKEIPEDIEKINVLKNRLLVDVLLEKRMVKSKSDFRRLFLSGSIIKLDSKNKINSLDETVDNAVYKIGKKRFIKIEIESK